MFIDYWWLKSFKWFSVLCMTVLYGMVSCMSCIGIYNSLKPDVTKDECLHIGKYHQLQLKVLLKCKEAWWIVLTS